MSNYPTQFPFPKIFVVVVLLVLFIGLPLMIIGLNDMVFSPERKAAMQKQDIEYFVVTDGIGNYRIGNILPNGKMWISNGLSFTDSSKAKEVVNRWNTEDAMLDSLKNVKWIRLNK